MGAEIQPHDEALAARHLQALPQAPEDPQVSIKDLTDRWLGYFLLCLFGGHDYFNGGEHCRDCRKPALSTVSRPTNEKEGSCG